ncbi:MAG: hypothetical protein RIB55_08855 [Nitratireductor sp.]
MLGAVVGRFGAAGFTQPDGPWSVRDIHPPRANKKGAAWLPRPVLCESFDFARVSTRGRDHGRFGAADQPRNENDERKARNGLGSHTPARLLNAIVHDDPYCCVCPRRATVVSRTRRFRGPCFSPSPAALQHQKRRKCGQVLPGTELSLKIPFRVNELRLPSLERNPQQIGRNQGSEKDGIFGPIGLCSSP